MFLVDRCGLLLREPDRNMSILVADTYDRLVLGFRYYELRLSSFSGVPRRRFLESLSRYTSESKMVSRILWCMRNSVVLSLLLLSLAWRSLAMQTVHGRHPRATSLLPIRHNMKITKGPPILQD